MKKIAIIGAGYMARIIAEEARKKKVKSICFSNDLDSVAKESVDLFCPISIFEKDKIIDVCKSENVNGVIATTELTIEIANYVAEKLGLITNPLDVMKKITNKAYVRNMTNGITGLSTPEFYLISNEKEIDRVNKFPVIVKPTQLGGKRGITVANNEDELRKAVKYAQEAIGQREQKIIVEEFLNGGNEYSVEGLSFGGKHYIIQVTEKISSGAPHCVELGHRQPANISSEMRKRIEKVLTGVFDRLQLKNGASHTEIKIIDNRIYLIEINFRPGGDHIASPLTELSTGYSYIGGAIDIALGCFEEPHIEQNKQKYAGVLFVTKQTKKYEKFFNGYENEEWMYKINHVSKELQDITHNDGFNTNYIMYCSEKGIPKGLE